MKRFLAILTSALIALGSTYPVMAIDQTESFNSVCTIVLQDESGKVETYTLNGEEHLEIPITQTRVQGDIAEAAEVVTAHLSINLVNDSKVEWEFIPLSVFYIPLGFTGMTQTTDLKSGAVYAGKNYSGAMSGSAPVSLPAEFHMMGVYQTKGFTPKDIEIHNYYG